jgi:hypothetical protein
MAPPVPRSVGSTQHRERRAAGRAERRERGLDLLGEVMGVGHDAPHPGRSEVVDREGRERAVEHGHKGLRALLGEGSQAGAEAGAEQQRVHVLAMGFTRPRGGAATFLRPAVVARRRVGHYVPRAVGSSDLSPGLVIDDRWELLSALATGSSGEVFASRERQTGRRWPSR